MRVATVIVIALLAAHPAFAQGLFRPLGPVAADQRAHLIRVTLITMIAVLPVLVGVPIILWRYRRGRGAAYRPLFEFSAPLEIVMWGVPALIVAVLSAWLWKSTSALDPYRPLGADPLKVQVIGLDWKWLFLYPDQGVASIGKLALPAGRPVRLTLTSDTVMQSFMIPSLGGQIYVMPGMVTELNLMADRPASAAGANTQFNGNGFAGQTITMEAMTASDWQSWVTGAADAPELDAQGYARLGVPGHAEDAVADLGLADGRMRLADHRLFDQVVQRYHSGEPLPPSSQPGAPGYQAEMVSK